MPLGFVKYKHLHFLLQIDASDYSRAGGTDKLRCTFYRKDPYQFWVYQSCSHRMVGSKVIVLSLMSGNFFWRSDFLWKIILSTVMVVTEPIMKSQVVKYFQWRKYKSNNTNMLWSKWHCIQAGKQNQHNFIKCFRKQADLTWKQITCWNKR